MHTGMPFELPLLVKRIGAVGLLLSANLQCEICCIPTSCILIHSCKFSPCIPFVLEFIIESTKDILPPVWYWSTCQVVTINALHSKSIHIKFVILYNSTHIKDIRTSFEVPHQSIHCSQNGLGLHYTLRHLYWYS